MFGGDDAGGTTGDVQVRAKPNAWLGLGASAGATDALGRPGVTFAVPERAPAKDSEAPTTVGGISKHSQRVSSATSSGLRELRCDMCNNTCSVIGCFLVRFFALIYSGALRTALNCFVAMWYTIVIGPVCFAFLGFGNWLKEQRGGECRRVLR